MQYGNLYPKEGSGGKKKKFKSYYVVWKHIAPAPAIIAFSLFKSYYVVWKLSDEEIEALSEEV